jgi:hypothetical protein
LFLDKHLSSANELIRPYLRDFCHSIPWKTSSSWC